MRSTASILAAVLVLTVEASVRFTEPVWRPDLGIAVPALANAQEEPLELPKAGTFLLTDDRGGRCLEDRFDAFDLWVSQTMRGRWRDADGNVLYIARLTTRPPMDAPGTVRTRTDFLARLAKRPFDPDNAAHRNEAVVAVAPADLGQPIRPRRSQRRNMKELFAYPSTNDHVFAAAFRPRSPERRETTDWYLVILEAAEGEALDEAFRRLDEDFLDHVYVPAARARHKSPDADYGRTSLGQEAILLREAVRRSVANYDHWHFAATEDVVVIDNLDDSSRATFVTSLTNSLPCLRRAYAACAPTPLPATNQLAVVRVFATREEYLAYVGVKHKWTAALWDTLHRELVLYLPLDGTKGLLQTVWHEAFHQYLAYAAALVTSAPWFNEGNAEMFEHSSLDRHGKVVFERHAEAAAYVQSYAADLAAILPSFLSLNYAEFYDGTQDEIAARYHLAWSLAYFLEVGAPDVRFQPFANTRRDYVKALIDTRSTADADRMVFNEELRKQFIAAWLDFWKRQ